MNTLRMLMIALAFSLIFLLPAQSFAAENELYIKPGVAPGGTGKTPDDPVPSIQDALDGFELDERGYVFLYPGIYKEDVVIDQGNFWLRPIERYGGVMIEGSITVREPNTVIRGFSFRSEGSAIVLDEGSTGSHILQQRIYAVGEGGAAIDVIGDDAGDLLISDTVVDLRDAEGVGRTGIRINVAEGVQGIRLDHTQVAGCETGVQVLDDGYGAGNTTLTGNRFIENGLGLQIAAPGVIAARNFLRDNTQAGIAVQAGPTDVEANEFFGNAAGIITSASDVDLTNNVIANSQGPAVSVESGGATLLHNTIYAAEGGEAALLEVAADAFAAARSNIFAAPGNLAGGEGDISAASNLYSHETSVEDEVAVIGEPGFVAPHNRDFHITADSPAAHAAQSVEIQQDADGVGRPWGPAASIGAYEVAGEREATTFYVAAGAADGDGSEENPFDAIAPALARALPGDTILVGPGEYALGSTAVNRSGAPDALITIRSETPHAAKMAGTAFPLSNCSYVRIEGFDFTGFDGNRPIQCGPYVTHCEFVNNVFVREEEGGGAIGIGGPGATDNLIEGNRIDLTHAGVGLQIRCQRHNWRQTIRNNYFSGCYYGIQTGGGSYPTAPPGYNLIEGNTFHANWKDGIHTKSTDETIRNNHFYGNAGSGITSREGPRIVIIGNWIHDNGMGMRLHSPSHFVINNLVYNNRGHGIYSHYTRVTHYEEGYEQWIAHNTVYGNGRDQFYLGNGAQAMVLRNIIVGSDPDKYGIVREHGGLVRQADDNLYFNCRVPLLREYEGGLYDRRLDPLLRDPEGGDFRPTPESPAWQMSLDRDALSRVISSDPAGVPLPDHIGSNLGPAPGGD